MKVIAPESWCCVDCGVNTAPGMQTRAQLEQALTTAVAAQKLGLGDGGVPMEIDNWSEVYTVRDSVWKAAGMQPWGGCLCIGCLEKRLGRTLRSKDFPRRDAFNNPRIPGTERLMERRGRQR